jgi:hypothetical protein
VETHEWREDLEIRTRNEYDHFGNTIYWLSEFKNLNDSVWQINLEVEQEWGRYLNAVLRYNEYGDLENVQKLIREMIDQGNLIEYETVFDFGYDYYCDDSIRERRAFVNGNLYERDRYAYLYPADCVPDVSKELVFYPNPTTGFIYLESSLAEAGQSKLIVLNAMGQQVNNMNIRFWAGIVEVDLSQLPNGIYFIWVFEEEGKRKEVVKVLKVEGS